MYKIIVKRRTKVVFREYSTCLSAVRAYTWFTRHLNELQQVMGYEASPVVEADFLGNTRGAVLLKRSLMRYHNNNIEVLLEVDKDYHFRMGVAYLTSVKGRTAISGTPNPQGRILLDKEPCLWLPLAEKYVQESQLMTEEEVDAYLESIKEDVGF